ncbi:hypothetical protein V8G54_018294, partial [Vigna mungo]
EISFAQTSRFQFGQFRFHQNSALSQFVSVAFSHATRDEEWRFLEEAEFPFQVIPHSADLHVAGGQLKFYVYYVSRYGCPGLSMTENAAAVAEVARVDASCSTFSLVHSSLTMLTIALCGSEAQKRKYLPFLAQMKTIACWALTEPDDGTDGSSLRTTASQVEGGWILDGQN